MSKMTQTSTKRWGPPFVPFVVGPFQCNCRLLLCPNTGEAALVDPGDEAETILSRLKSKTLPNGKPVMLKYLLHTHGHLDHIGATRGVKLVHAQAKIAIHREDEPLYKALKMQGEMFRLKYDDPLPVEHYLQHEERITVGNIKIDVIHTPGHSPGSVSLRVHEDSALGIPESVLTGDTLFQGSVGRTDLWGADQGTMFRSIKERLFTLDGDTQVCPGHGADSTIGIEARENPFL